MPDGGLSDCMEDGVGSTMERTALPAETAATQDWSCSPHLRGGRSPPREKITAKAGHPSPHPFSKTNVVFLWRWGLPKAATTKVNKTLRQTGFCSTPVSRVLFQPVPSAFNIFPLSSTRFWRVCIRYTFLSKQPNKKPQQSDEHTYICIVLSYVLCLVLFPKVS